MATFNALNVTVVFSGPHGIVTDLGEPVECIPSDPHRSVIVLPRYGVWRPDSRGKLQVVHTTDDRAEAIAKAQEIP